MSDTELREKAKKATLGPWRAYRGNLILRGDGAQVGYAVLHDDHAYIAAASPDVILDLLDRLEKAESRATTPSPAIVRALADAWKAYLDAVNTYNERLKLVRSERERGNYSMNVDAENREISITNSAFIKAAQDVAEAALSAPAIEADGWREIGTAPKTGETIIVRLRNGEVFSASWHVYGNPGWHVSTDIGFVTPHYWMPNPRLPAPPASTTEGGRG